MDLDAEVLQSFDGFLSRDYRKPGQIARPLYREMRAFVLLVPAPKEPDSAPQGPSSIRDGFTFRQPLICHICDQVNSHEIFPLLMNLN